MSSSSTTWDYAPAPESAPAEIAEAYGLFIDGEFIEALDGGSMDSIEPGTGQLLTRFAVAGQADVDAAVAAATRAQPAWAALPARERGKYLYRIARRLQERAREFAILETRDGGKPIKESRDVDIPEAAKHFFYYAGWADKLDYAFPGRRAQPVGVCAQIIPWNFPLLMAAWKLGPCLAAGNCTVLKPAEQTPASILVLMEIIGDLLPPGVINIVNGYGIEAGQALATSKRIAKIAFTGSTPVGSHILKCAAENIIPSTVELGGKSPNIYFSDVMKAEPEFIDKCVEGLVLAFFNQGEICTCPSRALVQEDMFEEFMQKVVERTKAIKRGNPLDTDVQVGAQASKEQFDKIMSYMEIGRQEGAVVLTGGDREHLEGEFNNGFYIQPTLFKGDNKMRVFQEEIFGPVVGVTTFKTEEEALAIANDTEFGLGAGVWTRDTNLAYRMGRNIQAGRVWMNCYHAYPAHAAFGGYKKSGVGRETHKMALEHYQQTKCMLTSYDTNPLGFF